MTVVQITETGAKGHGETSETAALQTGIDRVAAAGGGAVVPPGGMRCRIGTLLLRSRVQLHLERGSSLEVSEKPEDYLNQNLPVLLEATEGGNLKQLLGFA